MVKISNGNEVEFLQEVMIYEAYVGLGLERRRPSPGLDDNKMMIGMSLLTSVYGKVT